MRFGARPMCARRRRIDGVPSGPKFCEIKYLIIPAANARPKINSYYQHHHQCVHRACGAARRRGTCCRAGTPAFADPSRHRRLGGSPRSFICHVMCPNTKQARITTLARLARGLAVPGGAAQIVGTAARPLSVSPRDAFINSCILQI